jgi:hypothetical protein
MNQPQTIGDIATLVRSKNAGPFWLTIDIFCDNPDAYETLTATGVLTPQRIAALYNVDASAIRIFRLDDIHALKISFPRPTVQGGIRDRDMHAGQQHIPVTRLAISSEIQSA